METDQNKEIKQSNVLDTKYGKCWIMVTRYLKDYHGHQSMFNLQYRHAVTALCVVKEWDRMFSNETDYQVFYNKITLWVNGESVDVTRISRTELEEYAKQEVEQLAIK